MVTDLLLVLEDKGDHAAGKGLCDRLLPNLLTHKKLTFGGAITEVLSELLYWRHDAIQ
jgi:hypothetical protein